MADQAVLAKCLDLLESPADVVQQMGLQAVKAATKEEHTRAAFVDYVYTRVSREEACPYLKALWGDDELGVGMVEGMLERLAADLEGSDEAVAVAERMATAMRPVPSGASALEPVLMNGKRPPCVRAAAAKLIALAVGPHNIVPALAATVGQNGIGGSHKTPSAMLGPLLLVLHLARNTQLPCNVIPQVVDELLGVAHSTIAEKIPQAAHGPQLLLYPGRPGTPADCGIRALPQDLHRVAPKAPTSLAALFPGSEVPVLRERDPASKAGEGCSMEVAHLLETTLDALDAVVSTGGKAVVPYRLATAGQALAVLLWDALDSDGDATVLDDLKLEDVSEGSSESEDQGDEEDDDDDKSTDTIEDQPMSSLRALHSRTRVAAARLLQSVARSYGDRPLEIDRADGEGLEGLADRIQYTWLGELRVTDTAKEVMGLWRQAGASGACLKLLQNADRQVAIEAAKVLVEVLTVALGTVIEMSTMSAAHCTDDVEASQLVSFWKATLPAKQYYAALDGLLKRARDTDKETVLRAAALIALLRRRVDPVTATPPALVKLVADVAKSLEGQHSLLPPLITIIRVGGPFPVACRAGLSLLCDPLVHMVVDKDTNCDHSFLSAIALGLLCKASKTVLTLTNDLVVAARALMAGTGRDEREVASASCLALVSVCGARGSLLHYDFLREVGDFVAQRLVAPSFAVPLVTGLATAPFHSLPNRGANQIFASVSRVLKEGLGAHLDDPILTGSRKIRLQRLQEAAVDALAGLLSVGHQIDGVPLKRAIAGVVPLLRGPLCEKALRFLASSLPRSRPSSRHRLSQCLVVAAFSSVVALLRHPLPLPPQCDEALASLFGELATAARQGGVCFDLFVPLNLAFAAVGVSLDVPLLARRMHAASASRSMSVEMGWSTESMPTHVDFIAADPVFQEEMRKEVAIGSQTPVTEAVLLRVGRMSARVLDGGGSGPTLAEGSADGQEVDFAIQQLTQWCSGEGRKALVAYATFAALGSVPCDVAKLPPPPPDTLLTPLVAACIARARRPPSQLLGEVEKALETRSPALLLAAAHAVDPADDCTTQTCLAVLRWLVDHFPHPAPHDLPPMERAAVSLLVAVCRVNPSKAFDGILRGLWRSTSTDGEKEVLRAIVKELLDLPGDESQTALVLGHHISIVLKGLLEQGAYPRRIAVDLLSQCRSDTAFAPLLARRCVCLLIDTFREDQSNLHESAAPSAQDYDPEIEAQLAEIFGTNKTESPAENIPAAKEAVRRLSAIRVSGADGCLPLFPTSQRKDIDHFLASQ
eukprot:Sspe_Gene.30556::Locus_15106_Transcript_1_1_Confidence_1.000_Length_3923::g.30556::m.30556